MKHYIVENKIFTNHAQAIRYAEKRTWEREMAGHIQAGVPVEEAELVEENAPATKKTQAEKEAAVMKMFRKL